MPRGDGTGPMGYGPMTGRAAGYCAGYGVPGYANPGVGRGLGFRRGFGFGRGYRWAYRPVGVPVWARPNYDIVEPAPPYRPDKETEKRLLRERAEYLEDELKTIKKRIDELEED